MASRASSWLIFDLLPIVSKTCSRTERTDPAKISFPLLEIFIGGWKQGAFLRPLFILDLRRISILGHGAEQSIPHPLNLMMSYNHRIHVQFLEALAGPFCVQVQVSCWVSVFSIPSFYWMSCGPYFGQYCFFTNF